jgi:tetratricopeptide (TPR) repeat protein
MIVRDAEPTLASALESVRDIADELLITDTGSVDATLRIAEDFGAKVTHFPWQDDFAAARNRSVADATGDWILLLDADEALLPESRVELQRCMAGQGVDAYLVKREDLASADAPHDFTVMVQLRLIRRAAWRPMQGRIHEHFVPDFRAIAPSKIRLRHTGLTRELQREKLVRSARLLELELQDRPRQFYYLVEYGRTLLALGDKRASMVLAEAADIAVRTTASADVAAAPLALLLDFVLASRTLPAGFPLSAEQAIDMVDRQFGDSPPLLWHVACHEYRAGRFAECAARLELILKLGRNESYSMLTSFDPRILRDNALLNLGACYVRLAMLDRAEQCFERLLHSQTLAAQATENLRAIRQLRSSLGGSQS